MGQCKICKCVKREEVEDNHLEFESHEDQQRKDVDQLNGVKSDKNNTDNTKYDYDTTDNTKHNDSTTGKKNSIGIENPASEENNYNLIKVKQFTPCDKIEKETSREENDNKTEDLSLQGDEEINQYLSRPSIKQLFLNAGHKPPLEIINELRSESCNDSLKITEEKKKKTKNDRETLENLKFQLITEETNSEQNINQINPNTDKSIQKGTFSLHKLKQIIISDLIPEKKLMSSQENEVMFQGNIFKFNPPLSRAKVGNYIDKFCVMTRNSFLIYKSKETYLRMQKPAQEIDLCNDIKDFGRIIISTKADVKKKFYHFFIKLEKNYDANNIENIWSSKETSYPDFRTNRTNKMVVDSTKLSSYNKSMRDTSRSIACQEVNLKDTLVFAAKSQKTIGNWLVCLKYFSY